MRRYINFILAVVAVATMSAEPPVLRSHIGDSVVAEGGVLTIKCVGKKQNFNWADTATRDVDVFSPKSVNFHPDGSRFYVNSLEGCATVVYDATTTTKLKVIPHKFSSGEGPLWSKPSGYYTFTHYKDGATRAFEGKPVESAFSHGGRYLWVPYYRRTFDINAQDPSAIAIIDTHGDSIVRMMETGPLPKMIRCSGDGKTMAVAHWGDNTVGLIDISGDDPSRWHHLAPVVVDRQLQLNFSLTHSINRDANSGNLLRGTVWMPGDRYLLVACMGGGGIAVIDVPAHRYLGKVTGISNARHLIISHDWLYASVNAAGLVQRVPVDSVLTAIERGGTSFNARGWQTCHVGGGARTIEASPSGRYVFAACNSASHLYVVDTERMAVIARIKVDSYPVGLDISRDGTLVVVTSQARSGLGGNAVNLYRVTYADDLESKAYEQLAPQIAVADTDTVAIDAKVPGTAATSIDGTQLKLFVTLGVVALLLIVVLVMLRRRR